MASSTWTGSIVRRARAVWRERIAAAGGWPCCRCGRVIRPGDSFQVDHWPLAREHGGTETSPAHPHCNMAAGGRRGAQIVNARREQRAAGTRLEPRTPAW